MLQDGFDEIISTIDAVGDSSKRHDIALVIANIFANTPYRLSADRVSVLDNVLLYMIDSLDDCTRSVIANKLAQIDTVPIGVMKRLANDVWPDVFTPVLLHARCLDGNYLTERALSATERHLLVIADRANLIELVTDALISRALPAVLHRVAINPGARMTQAGFAKLVEHASGDDALARAISDRPDLPRNLHLRLIATASAKLPLCDNNEAVLQPKIFRRAGHDDAKKITADQTLDLKARAAAHAECIALASQGALDDAAVAAFALARDGVRVRAALVVLGHLNPEAIDSLFLQSRTDGLIVLGRALGLSWTTMRAVLLLREAGGHTALVMERSAFAFERLTPDTARMALAIQRRRSHESIACE